MQVSVDMFLFSSGYQDVASLGEKGALHPFLIIVILFLLACLPHYTSGQTYYYPAFNAARTEDAIKFAHEFGEVIATPIMLEAVMRVRASRGLVTPCNLARCTSEIVCIDCRIANGIVPWQLLCPFD